MATGMLHQKTASHDKKTSNFKILCFFLLPLIFSTTSHATDSVKITWEANGDPLIAGYKIYEGTKSRSYTRVATVGRTATSTTFTGLTTGDTYYFAATTYDKAGDQSAYSDEIVFTPGPATLSAAVRLANQFSFTVQGLSGQKYVIQSSTDLRNWTVCQTNVAPFQFTATNMIACKQQFFRACLAK